MPVIVYSGHVPLPYFAVPKIFCKEGTKPMKNKVARNMYLGVLSFAFCAILHV